MSKKDNRYVVTFEAYVYAPNDYMARKRAHAVNDSINAIMNVQDSDITGIVEQPFGTLGNRKLDDISKPREKGEDKELPF
tara:strand:+ start:466 stop:705 length:240 start_codon:yes stop_codon:yes gene_type:complete